MPRGHKAKVNKRSMSLITARSIHRGDHFDDTSDAESDVGSLSEAGSDASGPSRKLRTFLAGQTGFPMPLVGAPFLKTTAESGLGHEGWLAKSSSQNPRRWSRRYFVLRDDTLQSFMAPRDIDGTPQSVLHVSNIRTIRAQDASDATCRVFELEVAESSSPQQLRAETPEAMRRWLHVLEAACLVGSRPDSPSSTCCTATGSSDGKSLKDAAPSDCWETGSASSLTPTGDMNHGTDQRAEVSTLSASDISRCDSDGQHTLDSWEALSPNPVASLEAPSLEECFHLDYEELDRQLAAWLDTSLGKWHAQWHDKRNGGQVLQVLWATLGGGLKDAGLGPSSAAAAVVKHFQAKDSSAPVNAVVEAVLAEFLKRLRVSLTALLEDASVPASEVEDICSWWLLDARPAIEEFEREVAKHDIEVVDWRTRANELEHALLSEWEVRCCEELSAACETACFPKKKDDGLQLEAVLNPLRVAVQQIEHWNSREAVRDRAVSVLIAAMNAALRALRRRCNALVGAPQDSGSGTSEAATFSGRASHWATSLQRWALGKGTDPMESSNASEICVVASSAAAIANFCTGSEVAHNAACVDLMSTFSCAFEQLCEEVCGTLVGALFVSPNQSKLRVQFRKRELRKAHASPGGSPILLGPSIAAAEAFLSNLPGPLGFVEACKDHVVVGVIRALVRAWFLGLAQAPSVKLKSSGSSGLLCNAASLDAAALRGLQQRFQRADHAASKEDPIVALDILVDALGHESCLNVGRLRVAVQQLGFLLGRDVASAVELSLNAAFVI
jgi:hypothetical protein